MIRFVTNLFLTLLILLSAISIYRLVTSSKEGYNIFDLAKGTKLTATSPLGQASPTLGKIDPNDLQVLTKVNRALADLTDMVVPSVVSIDTKKNVNVRRYIPAGPLGLYGHTQNEQLERPAGLGSGAIVSSEGHIITNHHVISGADQIQITAHGGAVFEAEVLGADPFTDIAVLKIIPPAEGPKLRFKALKFGDSDQVRVGEMALAIGNPFGLNETVTRGIISAKQRQLSDGANEYFQVDAVINPGNSGGPLVNIQGELIGINVAIFAGQQNVKVWQGIGLSIPANEAREIYEGIVHGRPLERGILGVGIDEVPEQYVRALRLKTRGALIIEVSPDSPAKAAGIQPGDIVTKFNGTAIKSAKDFIVRIRKQKSGNTAKITVFRQGGEYEVEPVFSSKLENNALSIQSSKTTGQKITDALGIQVQDLNLQQRNALGVPMDYPAIMISSVKQGSQAERRFRAGDLIHSINTDNITDVATFYKVLENLPQKQSVMVLSRNGERFAAVIN